MNRDTMYVSQSEIGDFTRCRYKWYLGYIQRVTPKKTPTYFEDGSVFHNALENLGNHMPIVEVAKNIRKDYEGLLKEYKMPLTQEVIDDYTKRQVIVQGMVAGYYSLYGDEYQNKWELLENEVEFEVELEPGTYLVGKKDKRIRKNSDGFPYLVEHKTASQISSSYVNKLPRDQQTLTYAWSDWKVHPEEPVKGVIYDVIKKPGIRQKKGETKKEYLQRLELLYTTEPDKYFFRETLRYNKQRLKDFETHAKIVTNQMRDCIEDPKGKIYRGWSTACDDFGGCPYKDICNKRSLKGPHMKAFYKRDNKHQELEGDYR